MSGPLSVTASDTRKEEWWQRGEQSTNGGDAPIPPYGATYSDGTVSGAVRWGWRPS